MAAGWQAAGPSDGNRKSNSLNRTVRRPNGVLASPSSTTGSRNGGAMLPDRTAGRPNGMAGSPNGMA